MHTFQIFIEVHFCLSFGGYIAYDRCVVPGYRVFGKNATQAASPPTSGTPSEHRCSGTVVQVQTRFPHS